jgi:membrane protein implicated in regulation of membrane protease activity
MDISAPTLWWLAAGLLVAAELLSGTFYLLMLALGCAAGAMAAHAGLPAAGQVAAAALCGAGATAAWHLRRARSPRSAPSERNRDVNLDIGSTVQVTAWTADRTARVLHRGSAWSARLSDGVDAAPGLHVIVAVRGNELELTPAG